MHRLTDAANRYLKDCTWKDIAALKFCLLALGVMLGIAVPARCILSSKNPWFCQSKFLGIATGNPW